MRTTATHCFRLPDAWLREAFPRDGALPFLPGAAVRTIRKTGERVLLCPWNAAALLEAKLRQAGIPGFEHEVWPSAPIHLAGTAEPAPPVPDGMRPLPSYVHGLIRPPEARPEKWAGLYDYQRALLAFAQSRGSAFVGSPTGSGKAPIAILWGLSVPGLLLIITLSAVRFHFVTQIQSWTTVPSSDVVVLEGDLSGRWLTRELVRIGGRLMGGSGQNGSAWKPPRVVVASWELLPAWLPILLSLDPVSVVLDESQEFSSPRRWTRVELPSGGVRYYPKNTVAAAAAGICQHASVLRRLGTSATPARDRPRNLWAQFDNLEPRAYGSYSDFCRAYCGGELEDPFSGRPSDKGVSRPGDLLARYQHLVYDTPEVVCRRSLPPLTRNVIRLPPDVQDVRAVGADWQALAKKHRGDPSYVFELGLQRAASRKRGFVTRSVAGRLKENQKVVVFTGRRADVQVLAKTIQTRAALPGLSLWSCHGGTDGKERYKMSVAYLKARPPACFVATYDSMGMGVDLQDTDSVFVVMLPWESGALDQLEGRFTRPGQTRPVIVHYVIAVGTVDEDVADMLIEKLPAIVQVTGNAAAAERARALEGIEGRRAEILERLAERLEAAPDHSAWDRRDWRTT